MRKLTNSNPLAAAPAAGTRGPAATPRVYDSRSRRQLHPQISLKSEHVGEYPGLSCEWAVIDAKGSFSIDEDEVAILESKLGLPLALTIARLRKARNDR